MSRIEKVLSLQKLAEWPSVMSLNDYNILFCKEVFKFTFLPLLMYQSSSCCRCVSCLRYRTFATPPWPLSPAVAWCGSVRTYWVLSSSLRTSWPSFAVFPWRKERIRPTKAEILERRRMYFHLSCRWEISLLLLFIFHVSKLFGSIVCWCKFSCCMYDARFVLVKKMLRSTLYSTCISVSARLLFYASVTK